MTEVKWRSTVRHSVANANYGIGNDYVIFPEKGP